MINDIFKVFGEQTAEILFEIVTECMDDYLQTKTCRIRITGVRLAIDYYTNEEMKITGSIDTIEYEN